MMLACLMRITAKTPLHLPFQFHAIRLDDHKHHPLHKYRDALLMPLARALPWVEQANEAVSSLLTSPPPPSV